MCAGFRTITRNGGTAMISRRSSWRSSTGSPGGENQWRGNPMPIEVPSLAHLEAAGIPGMLSVGIPAHNEERHIAETVQSLAVALREAGIDYEILVINDNSSDGTERILATLSAAGIGVRYVNNVQSNGFGFAVRRGLAEFR